MEQFESAFNELLNDTFRSFEKIEHQALKNKHSLSMSEIHMLEAIGSISKKGAAVSEIAQRLGITLPSVTVTVNKLIQKGFLTKQKSEEDKRSVTIALTKHGLAADRLHRSFHNRMIRGLSGELNDEERMALMNGMGKINSFLKNQAAWNGGQAL